MACIKFAQNLSKTMRGTGTAQVGCLRSLCFGHKKTRKASRHAGFKRIVIGWKRSFEVHQNARRIPTNCILPEKFLQTTCFLLPNKLQDSWQRQRLWSYPPRSLNTLDRCSSFFEPAKGTFPMIGPHVDTTFRRFFFVAPIAVPKIRPRRGQTIACHG